MWKSSVQGYTPIIKRCRQEAGVSEKLFSATITAIRMVMAHWLRDNQGPKLGGWGKTVCIQETYWTKRKWVRLGSKVAKQRGTKSMSLIL